MTIKAALKAALDGAVITHEADLNNLYELYFDDVNLFSSCVLKSHLTTLDKCLSVKETTTEPIPIDKLPKTGWKIKDPGKHKEVSSGCNCKKACSTCK